jgi:hypothetical protein
MIDYRDFAIELTEDMGFLSEDMLVSCLKYMSQDDVKGMLEANEYPMSCEEDADVENDGQPDEAQEWADFDPDC